MKDRFGRTLDYLRISVTDRCNLRCYYCMPDRNPDLLDRRELLTYEEIADFARTAAGLGFKKIRLTGGEPLLRSDIISLVAMLRQLEGVEELCLTTNGVLLKKYSAPLFAAGLDRINVSLDTLDPERYHEKTGGGDLQRILDGLRAARKVGFDRIKLNCVVDRSIDEPDAKSVAAFGMKNGMPVRFIRQMNLARGEFWAVKGGKGGQCESCNRLRLSCDGQVRPCLFSNVGYSVRELGAREAIKRAVEHKPESGKTCSTTTFRRIGG
jgi:cyclic pyranopterin phosphate synthase